MNKDKLQKITGAIQGEIEAFGEVMDVSRFCNLQKKLEKYLTTDAVTGVLNRWKIEEVIENEINRVKSGNGKLCLLIIDIDKFKMINDIQGHNRGDYVLAKTVQKIEYAFEGTIGKSQRLGRWGGDEFVYICPYGSRKINAMIKRAMDDLKTIEYVYINPITVSIGIACFKKGDNITSFVARADKAMYRVKKKGGNGVEIIV